MQPSGRNAKFFRPGPENLQQALLSKELKRLRDSAAIEVINPVFRLQESS